MGPFEIASSIALSAISRSFRFLRKQFARFERGDPIFERGVFFEEFSGTFDVRHRKPSGKRMSVAATVRFVGYRKSPRPFISDSRLRNVPLLSV